MYRRFLRRVRLWSEKTGNGGRGLRLRCAWFPMTICLDVTWQRVVIGVRSTDLPGYDSLHETPPRPCFIDLVIPKPNAADESVIGSRPQPAYPERV
jgi:hypothetical protein